MKPIMLHGHERSITQIKYSREGDLIFSCAKDNQPNVWYSLNGERLGTFNGHNGAVWCIDVDWNTSKVLTGAADNTCKLWDCETGACLSTMETKTAVRSCGFSYSANYVMFTTDKTMGFPSEIHIYDVRDGSQLLSGDPLQKTSLPTSEAKITSAIWAGLDDIILTGHENGELRQYEMKTGDMLRSTKGHNKQINDIQLSKDGMFFITASKDFTAKLFDVDDMETLKTYKTERPVNSASISPLADHVVLGGGQEAMSVTTTSTRIGKFDARFFHMIFEEEFGSVKGHFGPINSLAFHPDGKSYSSGGEDGFVRVNHFDTTYLDFQFEF